MLIDSMQQPMVKVSSGTNSATWWFLTALLVSTLHLLTVFWLTHAHPVVSVKPPVIITLVPVPIPPKPVVEPVKPIPVVAPQPKPLPIKPKVLPPKPVAAPKPIAVLKPKPVVEAKPVIKPKPAPIPALKAPPEPILRNTETAKPAEQSIPSAAPAPAPAPVVAAPAVRQNTQPAPVPAPVQAQTASAHTHSAAKVAAEHGNAGGGASSGVVALERPQPKYPQRALSRGIEGKVTVSFIVNAQGEVESAEVVSAEPPDVFDDAALQAIRKWRFKQKMVNGQAVTQRATQTLHFKLPEE